MNSSNIVGAAPPPPGVVPNFIDPESTAESLVLAAAIWPAVTLPLVLIRLYTSSFIIRRWHRDDTFIILALIAAVGNSIVSGIQTQNGAGRHAWDVPAEDYERFMMLGSIGGSLTYNTCTMFVKVAILSFYLRFSTSRAFRTTTYIVMFTAVGYSLANAFAFAYNCRPARAYWDHSVQGSCVDSYTAFLVGASLNVGTDVAILLLPFWMLWPLRMGRARKIGLVLIMTTGGFVCAVSIQRLDVILAGDGSEDSTWNYLTDMVWLLCEMYTGIICACLPCLRAFAKHFFSDWVIFRTSRDREKSLTSHNPLYDRALIRGSALATKGHKSQQNSTSTLPSVNRATLILEVKLDPGIVVEAVHINGSHHNVLSPGGFI